MSLFTSTHFASAAAQGTDWRDTSKNVLEKLESIRTQKNSFNLGFLYISDHLADDATSILNLFRSVLGVENWVGSIGMGVLACGESYIDQPAIAALIGNFPADSFCVFPKSDEFKGSEDIDEQAEVKDWLVRHSPMLTVVHADPMAQDDPTAILAKLEQSANAYVVGGLTSSRSHHYQIANNISNNAISGVFFADTIPVSTALSQGCSPIGKAHTITRGQDFTINELEGRKAIEVFQNDLQEHATKKLGVAKENFKTDLKSLAGSDRIPKEYLPLFQGQVYIALPLSLSDQKDFMVRNISNINPDEGTITITQRIATGDRVMFVQRNTDTLAEDLTKSLLQLRDRVIAERGAFLPKGGLFFSCIARGFAPPPENIDEMGLIRDVIGDIPIAGFCAGGEICNARLYGYTGILVLFF
jgi:small ligand-binding sensory domain FIST